LGTQPDTIDRVEDREQFARLIEDLELKQPKGRTATELREARRLAEEIGYPVLLRPSYVLGGRAMQVVRDEAELLELFDIARVECSSGPVLIDQFLQDAIEIDVDCIADLDRCVVAGIMEHIEEAGVHSGDSACALPPFSLADETIEEIRRQAQKLAAELGVVGLMNIQFALFEQELFVLEVNPRASRTIPFVSKAIGHPLAKYAARVMVGETLEQIGFTQPVTPPYFAVKEAVFPFKKFPGVDFLLGPEMRSTGEVMGLASRFHDAFYKAQIAAGNTLPHSGTAFVSVRDQDKDGAIEVARLLQKVGLDIIATGGTQAHLAAAGISCKHVKKVKEGRPHVVDSIINGEVQMVVNTTIGKQSILDSHSIRHETVRADIPYFTTIQAAKVAARAMADECRKDRVPSVSSLQTFHQAVRASENSDSKKSDLS